jgi:hypothetical protein
MQTSSASSHPRQRKAAITVLNEKKTASSTDYDSGKKNNEQNQVIR